jgi:hypothetical protein
MWAAWVVAAIALAAVTFMFRFLIALLREVLRSRRCRVQPFRMGAGIRGHRQSVGSARFDNDCHATERNGGISNLDCLEKEVHVKQAYGPGLIVLDVRPTSTRMVWRSISSTRNGIFRGHGL